MKWYIQYSVLFLGIAVCPAFPAQAAPADSRYSIDIEKKMNTMRSLVTKAVSCFKKKSLEECCHSFAHDIRWRVGEIGIFVFDDKGVCYVCGNDETVIWKDFYDEKTQLGETFIPEMVRVGTNGGTVHFRWNNGTAQAYVRTVEKDGQTYIIGSLFFPASASFATKELVKSAIRYGEVHSAQELFEQINNPRGKFVYGDVYLYAYDFNGNIMAHGESKELVGQNVLNDKDPEGRYRTREMIALAKGSEGEGWFTYKSMQGEYEKRVYIQRFTDLKTGKDYLIGGGYYPNIDSNTVVGLVKRAESYLRANGPERAFPEFSKRLGEFATGSAMLFAYDAKGILRADMANPAFVGLTSVVGSVDMEGKPITTTILAAAENNPSGSWVGFSLKNSFAMMYVEKVSIPDGDFIVGAGYYPIEKYIRVRFMVDRAVVLLKNQDPARALDIFASKNADFFRGDLSILVTNEQGIILVDGIKRSKMWKDSRDIRDDKGRLISDKIAAIARSGGGWFEYAHNNALRRIYVDLAEKDVQGSDVPETYVVISGYYL
jgi:cytochrome c